MGQGFLEWKKCAAKKFVNWFLGLSSCTLYVVVRFNAYQISASIDAKNNGFTRELRCPPVLIYFTQACREAGVRLVQVTLKDWTLNAFRRNASSAGWP